MMKKIAFSFFCISAFVCFASFFSACSNPESEAEMNRLAIRNETLKRTVDSLQEEVSILQVQSDSVKKALKSLDMHK